jgi:hypothetical protein
VRRNFEQIVWVALGQQANLGNCQESIYLQLTGGELGAELAQEERRQKVQQAMQGMKLLLVLDGASLLFSNPSVPPLCVCVD